MPNHAKCLEGNQKMWMYRLVDSIMLTVWSTVITAAAVDVIDKDELVQWLSKLSYVYSCYSARFMYLCIINLSSDH